MIQHPHVVVLDGIARIVGTNILVCELFTELLTGTPAEELMKKYNQRVGNAAVLDALSFAYDHLEIMQHNVTVTSRTAEIQRITMTIPEKK